VRLSYCMLCKKMESRFGGPRVNTVSAPPICELDCDGAHGQVRGQRPAGLQIGGGLPCGEKHAAIHDIGVCAMRSTASYQGCICLCGGEGRGQEKGKACLVPRHEKLLMKECAHASCHTSSGANGGYKTQGGRSVQPSTLGPAQLRMAQRTQSHTEIVPLLSHAASPAQKLQNSVPITTSVSRYRVSEGESGVSARCRAAAAAAACI